MIAIINSGVANLTSVEAALHRLGAESIITSNPETIKKANHVILPGVGAARAAMNSLQEKGLIEVIQKLQQPVLGICLGMQMLFEETEEGEQVQCLGVIPGGIQKLLSTSDSPIPHIGWNQLELHSPHHPLLQDITDKSYMYYVHSYAAPLNEMTIASTYYGTQFTAMVARDNFTGCQFHPERSSSLGQRILQNFLGM